jgi:hypothetical protein
MTYNQIPLAPLPSPAPSYIITPPRSILGNLKKLLPVELCVTPVALVESL